MKPYKLKENEELIMQSKVSREGKLLNIITMYEAADKSIHIHNANGIKQDICPNLRYGCSYYCSKYAEKALELPLELWENTTNGFYFAWRNPKYKNCHELGQDLENYKDCKYYLGFEYKEENE